MERWERTQTYDFAGREIRYDVAGEGPPLVIVYGTPWSSYNLRQLIRGLAGSFRVYFYDLLGYGQSDQSPGDVSLGVQNEVLAALIRAWGFAKSCRDRS